VAVDAGVTAVMAAAANRVDCDCVRDVEVEGRNPTEAVWVPLLQ
jgi:hypothetical protein